MRPFSVPTCERRLLLHSSLTVDVAQDKQTECLMSAFSLTVLHPVILILADAFDFHAITMTFRVENALAEFGLLHEQADRLRGLLPHGDILAAGLLAEQSMMESRLRRPFAF